MPTAGARRPNPVARAWHVVVDGLAALGTMMIAALMVVIVADVLTRNLTGGLASSRRRARRS